MASNSPSPLDSKCGKQTTSVPSGRLNMVALHIGPKRLTINSPQQSNSHTESTIHHINDEQPVLENTSTSCRNPHSWSPEHENFDQHRFVSNINLHMGEFTKNAEIPAKKETETSEKSQSLPQISSRRMKWIKLIRLQLNSMRETQSTNTADSSQKDFFEASSEKPKSLFQNLRKRQVYETSKTGSPVYADLRLSPLPICKTSGVDDTPSSEEISPSAPWSGDSLAFTSGEVANKSANGTWRKKKANVRGRLSHFWRQAAIAALRNQHQTDTSGETQADAQDAIIENLSGIFDGLLPSREQVEKWQESFLNLLLDRHGLLIFREFLRGEFSDENIEFWIACKKYKSLSKRDELKSTAQAIYNDFIAFQSQREVNLDCETRNQVELRLANASVDLFDASQKRIEALMEKDPYRRFLRSPLYIRLREITTPQETSVVDKASSLVSISISESSRPTTIQSMERFADQPPKAPVELLLTPSCPSSSTYILQGAKHAYSESNRESSPLNPDSTSWKDLRIRHSLDLSTLNN